jgi:hypothetical protein
MASNAPVRESASASKERLEPTPIAEEPVVGDAFKQRSSATSTSVLPLEAEIGTTYQVADLWNFVDGDILDVPPHRIAGAVVACVAVEGPIHQDLVARRVATAWGYNRVGARIANQIDTALRVAIRERKVELRGNFLWNAGQSTVAPRAVLPDGSVRPIAHVADEEIIAASTTTLERALSLSEDELIVQTARVLGYSRTGMDIRRKVQSVVQKAIEDAKLVSRNGRVELPR